MSDFLDEKLKEIAARLDELRPLVHEYHRLESALQAMSGERAPAPARRTPPKRAAKPRPAGESTGKRGRPKGSGNRGNEALTLIKDRPGITIPELADAMGIKQNYLYRVVPGLQKDGLIRKEGRGWHALEAA